jgi:hypothetical protein
MDTSRGNLHGRSPRRRIAVALAAVVVLALAVVVAVTTGGDDDPPRTARTVIEDPPITEEQEGGPNTDYGATRTLLTYAVPWVEVATDDGVVAIDEIREAAHPEIVFSTGPEGVRTPSGGTRPSVAANGEVTFAQDESGWTLTSQASDGASFSYRLNDSGVVERRCEPASACANDGVKGTW